MAPVERLLGGLTAGAELMTVHIGKSRTVGGSPARCASPTCMSASAFN
jgi:hypothetical protein